MTLTEFKATVKGQHPPAGNDFVVALWHDAKGDWEAAHNIVQDINTTDGSWIHAYLHRKEGDPGNAGYWYNRAKRKVPTVSLDKEWEELAEEFLSR